MNCPRETEDIILEIIRTGLLRIRSASWEGAAAFAAAEADHLHNLPDLLREYSPAKLKYYWDVERPSYISRISEHGGVVAFDTLWQSLAPIVERTCATLTA